MIDNQTLDDINEVLLLAREMGIYKGSVIRFLKDVIPNNQAFEKIEEKLKSYGLGHFERKAELGNIYTVYAYDKDDKRQEYYRFKITITDYKPFTVNVELIDSYYNPVGDYDEDCGKICIDDEGNAFENENWSPNVLYGSNETYNDIEHVWGFLEEVISEYIGYYEEMEIYRAKNIFGD